MTARLEEKASADASKKAYCDKEFSESCAKKENKLAELDTLSSSIDKKTAQLKREVVEMQPALSELAASQAAVTKFGVEEKDVFAKNKQDLEDGTHGVRIALGVLQEYTEEETKRMKRQESTGIIGLLEVIDSDFSTNVAEITAADDNAVVTLERQAKENEIDTAKKEHNVEYKTAEAGSLDQVVTELSSDRDGVQAEYGASFVFRRVRETVYRQARDHAERKARREAEIVGLKEALSILSGGESLLMQKSCIDTRLRDPVTLVSVFKGAPPSRAFGHKTWSGGKTSAGVSFFSVGRSEGARFSGRCRPWWSV